MKICWVQHASEWPLLIPVAIALQERGIDSIFVCKDKETDARYRAKGFQSVYAGGIYAGKPLSAQEQAKLDLNYGPPGIRAILGSDLQLSHLFRGDTEGAYVAVAHAFRFWEEFLVTHPIDLFIVTDPAMVLPRTAYAVSKKRGIPLWQLVGGPGNGLITLDDVNENHVWSELTAEIEKGPRHLNDDERQRVHDFIATRMEAIAGTMRLRFVPESLYSGLKSVIGMTIRDTRANRARDPIVVGRWRYGRWRRWRKLQWAYITRIFFRYDVPQGGEQYVYFPIYSGHEASYLSNDHYWAGNEISLIKEVAQGLPIGTLLYVKEHPLNPGDFSFRQLRELQKVPNIRVLFPSFSAKELIEKSAAVFVVEGTTGWEAYLQKRPVVCLGNAFFSLSRLVYKISDMAGLPQTIWQAVRGGTSVYETNRDEWEWFIHAVISTARKGIHVRQVPPYGYPDDAENAADVAVAIAEKCTTLGKTGRRSKGSTGHR